MRLLVFLFPLYCFAANITRVNVGSVNSYTDTNSLVWAADTSCSGGTAFQIFRTITGTSDPLLYQTGRRGNAFSCGPYTVSVAGTYSFIFKLARYSSDPTGPHVFTVYANGIPAIANFNVEQLCSGTDVTCDQTVVGITLPVGTFTILFVQTGGQAVLNGLSIDTYTAPAPGQQGIMVYAKSIIFTGDGSVQTTAGGGGGSSPAGNDGDVQIKNGAALAARPLVTTVGTPGVNTNIPSEKAVRDALALISIAGGATQTKQLLDFGLPTRTSGTVLTHSGVCLPGMECPVDAGGKVDLFSGGPYTTTLSGTSSGTVWAYMTYNGTSSIFTLGSDTTLGSNVSCSSGSTCATGINAFPVGTKALWKWTVTSGSWDVGGGTSYAAAYTYKPPPTCSTGILCTAGPSDAFQIDTAAVLRKFQCVGGPSGSLSNTTVTWGDVCWDQNASGGTLTAKYMCGAATCNLNSATNWKTF